MSVELGDSYQAIYDQSTADMALGNHDQALAGLRRIVNRLVRLRPETIQRKPDLQRILLGAWDDLVDYLQREKRYDEAIALCHQVAEHLPGEHTGELRAASLRIARGEVEEGLADIRQLAERDPGFGPWYTLGTQYEMLDRYPEAASAYRAALARAANNRAAAEASFRLFDVYGELGQVDDALSAWNMAVVLDPELASQVEIVYRWLIECGELEQAAKYLRRENNAMRRAFYQGYLDQQAGRTSEARSQWRRVLDMDAHAAEADIAAWLEAALRLGEPERALEEVESLSEHDHPFPDNAQVLAGTAHAMVGDVEKAREWFDRALEERQSIGIIEDHLDAEDQKLFESLVTDPGARQALASYWQA